ncbi:GFA family protein [Pseudoalteromonas peptidolytica]|uniref:CENP-V/GFA domain-containing protein n=1 Tax=Pseudoalteromonas peptidolytica F12-50-A1 TaxID=1315280 RepID=A0A8I0MUC5_9GAMM|nr:GFA family protein [Pseudoalteromonas peptidolytica]MBE0345921.1 hypothetical protein [Pseudoalteromonas peptidolytica F12-50-A1]NLR17261.1 GFA family protein [Pseudoalteromonas peptidolytica]GEK11872.1 hypothetical protein PPE03_41210 [Pseudoalteromonas peptidolytica]
MAERFVGGCLCGQIRFTAIGVPHNPHTCSCKMCQRHSGALTLAWVEFARDEVSWDGEGGMPKIWRSSQYSSRAFCPNCGSTLGEIDDAPVIALALGVFDSNSRQSLQPISHSYSINTST